MTQEQIRERIAEYNKELEETIRPNQFTLNKYTEFIMNQITILQNLCEHEYENDVCIYCGKHRPVEEEK